MTEAVTAQCERVLKLACAHSLMIATAESCTGGLLAALLTEVEDVSHAFDRGFVVYTDEAKAEILGVKPETLARAGAVSALSAAEMAQGALDRSRAEVAVAITGYAGGRNDPAPGLVYFGLAARGIQPRSISRSFSDDTRARVRLGCVRTALDLLGEGLNIAAQTAALKRGQS